MEKIFQLPKFSMSQLVKGIIIELASYRDKFSHQTYLSQAVLEEDPSVRIQFRFNAKKQGKNMTAIADAQRLDIFTPGSIFGFCIDGFNAEPKEINGKETIRVYGHLAEDKPRKEMPRPKFTLLGHTQGDRVQLNVGVGEDGKRFFYKLKEEGLIIYPTPATEEDESKLQKSEKGDKWMAEITFLKIGGHKEGCPENLNVLVKLDPKPFIYKAWGRYKVGYQYTLAVDDFGRNKGFRSVQEDGKEVVFVLDDHISDNGYQILKAAYRGKNVDFLITRYEIGKIVRLFGRVLTPEEASKKLVA